MRVWFLAAYAVLMVALSDSTDGLPPDACGTPFYSLVLVGLAPLTFIALLIAIPELRAIARPGGFRNRRALLSSTALVIGIASVLGTLVR